MLEGFAIGMTVLILHIYMMQVVAIPWVHSDSPDSVFFNPIPQSIALSIFSAWCILEMIRKSGYKLYKISLIFLLLAATYAVFAISQQRSGYVAWLTACSTVLIFSLGSRQRLMAIFTILFLFVAIVMSSSKIQGRIEQAKMDIASYEYKNNYSSIGSRLHMWFTGAQLIKEAPMLGHGLGSYPVVSAEKFKDPAMCAIACVHPHNQYIFYAIEFGSIGFLLFLSFFVSFFIRSSSNTSSRIISNAILLVIIIVGLFDITLWYRGFIYMFVPLLALNISSN
jgi:O-antigen ligase